MNIKTVKINICMGSSCFTRGNSLIVKIIEDYIKENHLEDNIKISGSLCMGNCAGGPNIIIDDKTYTMADPECVIDLIKYHMGVS